MDGLLHELRVGFRMLLRTPLLSLVAILTVGLGVGATSFAFSVVYGTLIRDLPVRAADRLMVVRSIRPEEGDGPFDVTLHDFHDYREQQSSFAQLGAGYSGTVNVGGDDGTPERYQGGFVTAEMLSMLGVAPLHGRLFAPGDDQPGAPALLLLGYEPWRNRFGADPGVVGRSVRVNGEPATVIGVMPQGFKFPFNEDVWVPHRVDASTLPRGGGTTLTVAGYLRDAVSLETANQEAEEIGRRIATAWPEQSEGVSKMVMTYQDAFMPPQIRTMMMLLMAMVTGVLLVACANVANILLARSITREKEVAIRSALGARRGRVVRQLLAEAAALGIAGGLVGIVISWISLGFFNASLLDVSKPYWIVFKMDFVAILFTSVVTIGAALVAGTVPALRASGTQLDAVLRDEARGSSSLRVGRFSTILVVGELAVSCGLMIGAGLLVRALMELNSLDLGFSPAGIMTSRVGLFEGDYPDPAARNRFYEDLLIRLRSEPGIQAAALTTNLPATGQGQFAVQVEGESYAAESDVPVAGGSTISNGLFETFGVRILEGRDFEMAETRVDASPVAIVNQSFVDRLLGGGAAVGKRIRLGRQDTGQPWIEIVGVVPDLYEGLGDFGSGDRLREAIYLPLRQTDPRFISVAVRAGDQSGDMAAPIRRAVGAVDAGLPIYFVRSMQEAIDLTTFMHRLFGSLFAIFGASALFLAAVGLYGVIDFSVSSRLREMGLRRALGAESGDLLRMVFRRVLIQLAVGAALGVGIGVGLAIPLSSTLFGVQTWDPLVYGGIVGMLALTGVLAALFPALRALRVHPVTALRA
jgi:putative ABC transport system permease protein